MKILLWLINEDISNLLNWLNVLACDIVPFNLKQPFSAVVEANYNNI